MKKSLLLIAAIAISMLAKAWEVGDYYDLDGVPSIIVWVDSTGEHGLRMSPAATYHIAKPEDNLAYRQDKLAFEGETGKQNKLARMFKGDITALTKKTADTAQVRWEKFHEQYVKIVDFQNNHLKTTKKTKQAISIEPLLTSNSEFGEINMKAVLAFCENNNYDMEAYFPSYFWATTLGEKWFIPGAHEADLISKILTPGLGVALQADSVNMYHKNYLYKIGAYCYSSFDLMNMKMLSSTLILSDWTKDPDNNEMIGYVEVPESEKKGGWYDYNELYTKNAHEYYGDEAKISLIIERIHYIPPFNVKVENIVDYYLMMKNAEIRYTHAVCYF